ncbi:GNAT family N-acetyltransferase [Homoserinimonas sp. OAct 916]|uniref:GNAT family N-acetyltransferase n=1 Tax=Homoserinimonas sp. OAct 916 TaxID=2211450 RepID=UPI000DBE889F|nr:GNAT family N-acetyltransferase [Homoserinimonas sp. OAct 916]
MTAPSTNIRTPVLEDAPRLGYVHSTCFREVYRDVTPQGFVRSLDPQELTDSWTQIIAYEGNNKFVAEVEGEIVGFSSSGPGRDDEGPRDLELYSIYLLSKHYGSGLGQKLLDAAVGDEPAYLWVAEDNARSQTFYERNGFTADGARRIEDFIGTASFSEIRMRR